MCVSLLFFAEVEACLARVLRVKLALQTPARSLHPRKLTNGLDLESSKSKGYA